MLGSIFIDNNQCAYIIRANLTKVVPVSTHDFTPHPVKIKSPNTGKFLYVTIMEPECAIMRPTRPRYNLSDLVAPAAFLPDMLLGRTDRYPSELQFRRKLRRNWSRTTGILGTRVITDIFMPSVRHLRLILRSRTPEYILESRNGSDVVILTPLTITVKV